jgi:Terminase small subunit
VRREATEGESADAAWLLRRLIDEASADIADLYDGEGKLKPVAEWPEVWRQGLVLGLEIEERFEGRGNAREQVGFVKKIRLSDRLKRLELIGKHIGVKAFEEMVRVKGLEGLGERLARAAKRLAEEGE